jgi:hypothetical protein
MDNSCPELVFGFLPAAVLQSINEVGNWKVSRSLLAQHHSHKSGMPHLLSSQQQGAARSAHSHSKKIKPCADNEPFLMFNLIMPCTADEVQCY